MNIFQRNAKYIVILTVLASSTSGIFAKLVSVNSLTLGFYRHLFALPMFIIPVMLYQRENLKKLTKKQVGWSLLAGFFLFLHFFTWFSSVKYTTIAGAVVLVALHPIVVIIITIFVFKTKVSPKAVAGIIIALVGGAIITGFDYSFEGTAIIGDLFALAGAISMGIYLAIGEKVREFVQADIYVMLVFGMSFACFSIGMIGTNTPFVGFAATNWIWIIGATLVNQIGAHAVWNWSMGYVSSLYVSAWGTGEIAFAIILAFFIFGEIPTVWQIMGAIIVLVGLLYYNFNDRKVETNEL